MLRIISCHGGQSSATSVSDGITLLRPFDNTWAGKYRGKQSRRSSFEKCSYKGIEKDKESVSRSTTSLFMSFQSCYPRCCYDDDIGGG